MAPPRAGAEQAFDRFVETYEHKYPHAVECLKKDRDVLLTFYDFLAEHWIHLRTTNPIESTFATVRLRHRRTKGNGSRGACLAMVFKLSKSAARPWRLLTTLAVAQRCQVAARRNRRHPVHRWRKARKGRRLITTPSTTFDNSS